MLDLRSVVFNLFALAHFSHVTYPLPTTTTTTTTTTTAPPVQVEIGEPSFTVFSDPCKSCERFLGPYLEPMRQHNMTAMAGAMDLVCNTAVPAVEQCKIDTGLARCLPERASPRVPTFNFFCRHKTVIQASTDCWANGYTESLQDCLAVFIAEGPTVGACQAVRNTESCVRSRLQQIPQCSPQAISFTSDYLTFAGHFVCPDLASP